jgi:hypothetical protein
MATVPSNGYKMIMSRRLGVLALVAGLAATGSLMLAFAGSTGPGHTRAATSVSAFRALVPAPAPAGWSGLPLPNGTAVLSYPPTLRPVISDGDAVSAARLSPGGGYLLYLNATPRQGGENLQNWAAYRLRVLTSEDASSAREDAAATELAFLGGTGSCVIDDYITRIGAHHLEELACLVQGRAGASVIVAAAPAARWAQSQPLLERAVAAYSVR